MMRTSRSAAVLARGFALACAMALALAGCGGKSSGPTAPASNLPPNVTATSPPVRSAHISTETPIWAQFDRPLDTSTVDTRHVALKIDTRRLPISVAYDAAHQRIVITPTSELALFTTHTVEFQPGLRTADGDSLGATYFWQFTTLGVRRPRAPYPADAATGESPFVELLWQGTESTAGGILYDLYADPDSNAVATHISAPWHLTTARLLPVTHWSQAGPLFWTVHTSNQSTGEQLDGPVWRFDPLPADTPVDSLFVPLNNWWYGNPANLTTYSYFCQASKLVAGANFDNLEQWDLSALGPGARFANVGLMVMPTFTYRDGNPRGLGVYSLLSTGRPCAQSTRSPFVLPKPDQLLAPAAALSDLHLRMSSDALAAVVESMARRGTLDALELRAGARIEFLAGGGGLTDPNAPRLVITYYRPPAPPALHSR